MEIWDLGLLLGLLQTKHLLADYVWQTAAMVRTKGIYGHPVGASHSALHAVLSGLILLAVPGTGIGLAGAIVIAEFIVHYHTDWSKDQLSSRLNQNPKQKGYWVLVGLDQYLHQLTYLAIVVVAFSAHGA